MKRLLRKRRANRQSPIKHPATAGLIRVQTDHGCFTYNLLLKTYARSIGRLF
jgi:hypothetical protein